MDLSEKLVFEYANQQNYVNNNIAQSIRIWKKILRNPAFSGNIKFSARCALITQYRFLLQDLPILGPIIDEYMLQNKQYRKTHKVIPLYLKRYDTHKVPITRKDIKEMKFSILLAVFDKDSSK
tara:strand:- start:251 stop:619 length:369 start_codon:yes stop_codon:yes gene_type:complete